MLKAEKYYEELKKYENSCQRLIKTGGAFLVVIASHELYRFTYPYEPCANFENTDPVNFITGKIVDVNRFLEESEKSLALYDFDPMKLHLEKFDEKLNETKSIEEKTSDVYTSLWKSFDKKTLYEESKELILKRMSKEVIEKTITGKTVLDMGCGSGRYSLGLSSLGAKKVTGVDISEKAYSQSVLIAKEENLDVDFMEANFLELPFEDESFDFVFSNGTLHHSSSIEKSLGQLNRVLKKGGNSFIYLYATGGIFWDTRDVMRRVFSNIPQDYTNTVLGTIGMPSNRFFFSDVWHVPIEVHTSREDVEKMFAALGLEFSKIISQNAFDLDYALSRNIKDAEVMWGDGEHRYMLVKK